MSPLSTITHSKPKTTIHLLLLIPTPFEAGALPQGPSFSTPVATVHTHVCGIGPTALQSTFKKATQSRTFDALLLAGFAGAIDPALPLGSCHESSPTSEPTTAYTHRLTRWPIPQKGDRPLFACPDGGEKGSTPPASAASISVPEKGACPLFPGGVPMAKLVSSEVVVASAAEKARLFATTGAQLVDMEGEMFAGLARELGVPWRIIRCVSDDAAQELPTGALAAGFDATTLTNRPLRLLAYLARHPAEIAPFVSFVRGLGPARRELTKAIMAACS